MRGQCIKKAKRKNNNNKKLEGKGAEQLCLSLSLNVKLLKK
jgi:hypothetical protein